VRGFLLQNLLQTPSGFDWRLNFNIFLDWVEYIVRNPGTDLIDPRAKATFSGDALFVGGINSPYLSEHFHQNIYSHFPNAQVEMVDGAGHYVHHENPKAFYETLERFLKE
jgi:pimeloyl-ACP methyl ester carboxylesterase